MTAPASVEPRGLWGSQLGFLLAAVGSAIGLGNIWRFSYMAFEHGGGAFLIPYVVALLVVGIPLMILEYALGNRYRASAPLAFARIGRRWEWVGWWMPTIALFGIMVYYAAVIGWCINYFLFSLDLAWGADAQGFFFSEFLQLSDDPRNLGGVRWPILAATVLGWALCWSICFRGISRGIERACLLFMPLLFLLTMSLAAWTLSLDGAWVTVREHYLTADWTKINVLTNPEAWRVWAAAFGQIFFTLSLGFGIMITYASYLPRKARLARAAIWTSGINSLYSFIAGFAVFGIVGFMAGQAGTGIGEVIKGGPQLAFVVYPEAIRQLPFGGEVFGALFFFMLLLAGLSSGISLVEAFSCALRDKFGIDRRRTVTVVCVLGCAGSVLFTTRAGLLILDIVDHFITQYGLVLGGLLECLLAGWLLGARSLRVYIDAAGNGRMSAFWDFSIRWLTPALLLTMLLRTGWSDLTDGYGGYEPAALLVYGVAWLLLMLVAARTLSRLPPRVVAHAAPDVDGSAKRPSSGNNSSRSAEPWMPG